jgi:two-component system sensor histidine kinase KdpD
LNRDWHPLEELIGSALERCKMKLARHEVAVRLPPDVPMVHVDGVLLEKLFVNLLENAAKYTPPGTHIAIGAARSEGLIDVIVEDDGPGIPQGLQTALFDKFTRANNESAVAGSGLGLSICRAIAQLHEMKLTAENRAQGGARFVLSIAYAPPPTAEPEA